VVLRSGYLCLGSLGSLHLSGVTSFYPPGLSCSALCNFDGCFVLGEFTFRDSDFCVACCYAPNGNPDRDAFFIAVLTPLIRLFLLSCGVIIKPFLIVLLTILSILPVRVATSYLSSFVNVASLISGILNILHVWFYTVQEGWLFGLLYRSPLRLLQTY